MERKIAGITFTEPGVKPLLSSENFRYEETANGVVVYHGKSAHLIPWHRIYALEYKRLA